MLFESENGKSILAMLLANPQGLLDGLMINLVQFIVPGNAFEASLEALKTLQNLSIVASSGFEEKFKPLIEVIAT